MKKSITGVVALLAGALAVHSQGTVSFANYVALAPYIYVSLGGVSLGGSATGLGSGNGDNWTVALYGAPGWGEAASSLFPLEIAGGDQPITATLADGDIDDTPGTWFSTDIAEIPYTVGSDSYATVQIRAWYNGGGFYTTYNAAVAAGAATGASATADIITGGPTESGFPSLPAGLPSGTGAGQLGNIILSGLLLVDGYGIEVNPDNTITIVGYRGPGGPVTIPTNIGGLLVTTVGDDAFNAFSGNTDPTSITFPDSITSIGSDVFIDCINLTNMVIGSGVTNIGSLDGCTMNVSDSNPVYSSVGGVLFNKNQTTLIECPQSEAGTYAIPATVTSIGGGAFGGCTGLVDITIPDTVTNIGSGAFIECISLTNLVIPRGVTAIQDSTFSYCESLTNFTIPTNVTYLGGDVFEACTSLGSITIPNGVTNIGGLMFDNCTRMTNITIPGSVINIDWLAFYNCSSLSSMYFEGNSPAIASETFNFDNLTAYYLPGTSGWTEFSSNTGFPAVLWRPRIELVPTFGVQSNTFGFNVSWADNLSAIVEACTNLANPVWQPLQTNTLNGGSFYFVDPQRTNYPGRFYRVSGQ
jgi:hypothetical protein